MPRNRRIIINIIKEGTIGCEIGVWKGEFSKYILDNVPLKKLYMIDPWKASDEHTNRWYTTDIIDQAGMDKIYEEVIDKFKNKQVEIIRDYSSYIDKYIKDDELDWVYIDGDHSRKMVYTDLVLSYRKVRFGGYIMGDDYSWKDRQDNSRPVMGAVKEFLRKYKDNVRLISVKKNQYIIKKII